MEFGKRIALDSVLEERQRQDDKWGVQNHSPFVWNAILVEEVGEFSQASLQACFAYDSHERVREEAVQVAAVALAMIECLDRGEWKW